MLLFINHRLVESTLLKVLVEAPKYEPQVEKGSPDRLM